MARVASQPTSSDGPMIVKKRSVGSNSAAGKSAGMIFVSLLTMALISGCGLWFQETIRADRGAVDEVRSIGRVVAQTTEDPVYGDVVQIQDVLILDMGSTTFRDAISLARNSLEKLHWATVVKFKEYTSMESTRWEGVKLTIYPFEIQDSDVFAVQNRIAETLRIKPAVQDSHLLVMIDRVEQ